MASRRKYRKKRGNRLEEFQHGISMIIRIMKDILPELKVRFLFHHWRTTVIGLYGTCSGLSFSFFLFFFSFSPKWCGGPSWAAKRLTEIQLNASPALTINLELSTFGSSPRRTVFNPQTIPLPAPRLPHARACTRFRFTVY